MLFSLTTYLYLIIVIATITSLFPIFMIGTASIICCYCYLQYHY